MSRSLHAGRNRGPLAGCRCLLLGGWMGLACGGEVVWDSGETGGTAASSGVPPIPSVTSAAPGAATGGAKGAGGMPGGSATRACESASAPSASLLWEGIGYDGYAFSPGYFGFSPNGLELESPGRTRTAYDVESGAVLGTTALTVAFRDRDWKREVVSGQVLEVESRNVLVDVGSPNVAALSGDGRFFFWLDDSCGAGSLNVYRKSVDSQQRDALSLSGFCDGGWLPTLTVTASGSAALAATGSGRLWHADFERGRVSSIQVHTAPMNSGTGVSVALSPDEHSVAVLGADQRLRTFTYPEFVPVLSDLPAASTYAFSWCYCQALWFAPIAWSADGNLLAAADENGHAVVRRACDGQVLATLDSPAPLHPIVSPPRPWDLGPMYLAFAPDGAGLAVGFESRLRYFGLAWPGE
jgi:WD40 repeat protein